MRTAKLVDYTVRTCVRTAKLVTYTVRTDVRTAKLVDYICCYAILYVNGVRLTFLSISILHVLAILLYMTLSVK